MVLVTIFRIFKKKIIQILLATRLCHVCTHGDFKCESEEDFGNLQECEGSCAKVINSTSEHSYVQRSCALKLYDPPPCKQATLDGKMMFYICYCNFDRCNGANQMSLVHIYIIILGFGTYNLSNFI